MRLSSSSLSIRPGVGVQDTLHRARLGVTATRHGLVYASGVIGRGVGNSDKSGSVPGRLWAEEGPWAEERRLAELLGASLDLFLRVSDSRKIDA